MKAQVARDLLDSSFFPVPILNFTEKNIRVKEKFFRRSLHFTHKQRPCHFELDSPLLCRFKNDWFIFSPLAQSHTHFFVIGRYAAHFS